MVILFLGFCSLVRGVWSFTMAIKTEYESILGSTEHRRERFCRLRSKEEEEIRFDSGNRQRKKSGTSTYYVTTPLDSFRIRRTRNERNEATSIESSYANIFTISVLSVSVSVPLKSENSNHPHPHPF